MTAQRVYLTFDIDWAGDEVLLDVLHRLERYRCRATFFVTHDSPIIGQMETDPNVERGIHPNFNARFAPDTEPDANPWDPIAKLKDIVPEAISTRSHSLVQGTPLLSKYEEFGLRLDSNVYIPFRQSASIDTWQFWTGTQVVPFVWSDYIDFLRCGEDSLNSLFERDDCIHVVAFHPIHIYLNTGDVAHYARFKESGLSPAEARATLSPGAKGVGDVFDSFLSTIRSRGLQTGLLQEFLEQQANSRHDPTRRNAA